MTSTPLVSVIMPVYNGSLYLRDAVDSILNQTYQRIELIVVDDCSADESREIISEYHRCDPRITLLCQKYHGGVAAALNAGLTHAAGSLIARMDADDISALQRIERQVDFLKEHPAVDILGTAMLTMTEGEKHIGLIKPPEDHWLIRFLLLFNCTMLHPTIMCRRNFPNRADWLYPTESIDAEDYALWAGVADSVRFHNLREPLLRYRLHPTQVSADRREQQQQSAARISRRLISEIDDSQSLTWQRTQQLYQILLRFCSADSSFPIEMIDAEDARILSALLSRFRLTLDVRNTGLEPLAQYLSQQSVRPVVSAFI